MDRGKQGISDQSLRTNRNLARPIYERNISRSQQENIGTNPDRRFGGSNPRGNTLKAPAGLNTQVQGESNRMTPQRVKTLGHQVISNTPFHKDPLKVAQMKQSVSLEQPQILRKGRYGDELGLSGVGPTKFSPNPVMKQSAVYSGVHTMRGHTDRDRAKMMRNVETTRANNNNLNRDRVFN